MASRLKNTLLKLIPGCLFFLLNFCGIFQSVHAAPSAPSTPGIPTAPNPAAQGGGDFTDLLVLRKGLKIVFPIHNGLDTRWKLVGDYNFIVDIDYNDQRGYRFKWHMTPPADISGLRAVEPEDVAQADKVSLFYPANEANSRVGFASIVRVSDKLYAKLKAGENCEFALDGPDSPLVLRKETMPQAHEIRRDGEETLTIEVDGMKVPVRAIRATTDAGWSYWILDNPNFPIMLKGSGPFQWDELKLAYEGGLLPAPSKAKKPRTRDTTGGETKKANREAENIIKHLKESGEAT